MTTTKSSLAAVARTLSSSDSAPNPTRPKKPGKKRVRNFTADDRAAHRLFEKGRREAFKERLVELAQLIPALADVRRLSKHVIVDESIARLELQQSRCLAAIDGIRELLAERDELVAEVNEWRSLQEQFVMPRRQAKPLKQPVIDLFQAEKEVFGAFPEGFGEMGQTATEDESYSTQDERSIPAHDHTRKSTASNRANASVPEVPQSNTIDIRRQPEEAMGAPGMTQTMTPLDQALATFGTLTHVPVETTQPTEASANPLVPQPEELPIVDDQHADVLLALSPSHLGEFGGFDMQGMQPGYSLQSTYLEDDYLINDPQGGHGFLSPSPESSITNQHQVQQSLW